jgi:hypothetical protein
VILISYNKLSEGTLKKRKYTIEDPDIEEKNFDETTEERQLRN